jgi:Tol biopolymer transport system component
VRVTDNAGRTATAPDGRFVLFSGRITASPIFQLWVLDRSTGERRFLFDGHPEDWHPSGRRFVYISNEFCSEAIHEAFVNVTATGLVVTNTRILFDSDRPAGALGVQYSPDGNRIAFDYGFTDCWYSYHDIFIGSLTGILPLQESDLNRLTSNDFCDARPHWTSDGRQIICGRSNGLDLELWRTKADGSGSEQLGTWSNAESAYLAFCTPPVGYRGPYAAAFYDSSLKDIILLKNDGGQDTLDIGPNDFVDGLDWVGTNSSRNMIP